MCRQYCHSHKVTIPSFLPGPCSLLQDLLDLSTGEDIHLSLQQLFSRYRNNFIFIHKLWLLVLKWWLQLFVCLKSKGEAVIEEIRVIFLTTICNQCYVESLQGMQSNSRDYYGMLVQPFLASLLQRFLLACMRVKGESWLVQLRKWRQYAGCLRLFYSCVHSSIR